MSASRATSRSPRLAKPCAAPRRRAACSNSSLTRSFSSFLWGLARKTMGSELRLPERGIFVGNPALGQDVLGRRAQVAHQPDEAEHAQHVVADVELPPEE